mmetsp:Transcript_35028/g.80659  ORF Transcript_35028/g.80659 Transcript_35028/m.80659 type:complete len:123 (+) Transcript_35028:79-447(+)
MAALKLPLLLALLAGGAAAVREQEHSQGQGLHQQLHTDGAHGDIQEAAEAEEEFKGGRCCTCKLVPEKTYKNLWGVAGTRYTNECEKDSGPTKHCGASCDSPPGKGWKCWKRNFYGGNNDNC